LGFGRRGKPPSHDLVAEIADARLAGEFLGGQVRHMAHGEGQIEEERLAGGVLFAP